MPSSSLFLGSSTTLVFVLSLISLAITAPTQAIYSLDTDFFSGNFYDHFNFFADADPTHGFVTYVNRSTAENYGPQNQGVPLIQGGNNNSPARINVDFTNTFNSSQPYYGINNVGRTSIRIESQKSWTHGLIVVDISHMPGGICGTWPAFWTLGSGAWPGHGEVDIIEGWDDQTTNFASAHVANNCTMQQSNLMTGTVADTDCNWYDGYPDNPNYTGCKDVDSDTRSFGTGFNNIGGGVYAMEWTSEAIKIFFFPRGKIPIDVLSNHPVPSKWGTPVAYIGGSSCNIDQNFNEHRIVFDDTFCGDAAGPNFGTCASKLNVANDCAAYVGQNPSAFRGAFWEVNALKVYKTSSANSTTTSATTTKTWWSTTTTSLVTPTKSASSTASASWTTRSTSSPTTSWSSSWTSSHPTSVSSSSTSTLTWTSTWTSTSTGPAGLPSSSTSTWSNKWTSTSASGTSTPASSSSSTTSSWTRPWTSASTSGTSTPAGESSSTTSTRNNTWTSTSTSGASTPAGSLSSTTSTWTHPWTSASTSVTPTPVGASSSTTSTWSNTWTSTSTSGASTPVGASSSTTSTWSNSWTSASTSGASTPAGSSSNTTPTWTSSWTSTPKSGASTPAGSSSSTTSTWSNKWTSISTSVTSTPAGSSSSSTWTATSSPPLNGAWDPWQTSSTPAATSNTNTDGAWDPWGTSSTPAKTSTTTAPETWANWASGTTDTAKFTGPWSTRDPSTSKPASPTTVSAGGVNWSQWPATTGQPQTTCSQPDATVMTSCSTWHYDSVSTWPVTSTCTAVTVTPTPVCWVCEAATSSTPAAATDSSSWAKWSSPAPTLPTTVITIHSSASSSWSAWNGAASPATGRPVEASMVASSSWAAWSSGAATATGLQVAAASTGPMSPVASYNPGNAAGRATVQKAGLVLGVVLAGMMAL